MNAKHPGRESWLWLKLILAWLKPDANAAQNNNTGKANKRSHRTRAFFEMPSTPPKSFRPRDPLFASRQIGFKYR
jgi:hypothetical protein